MAHDTTGIIDFKKDTETLTSNSRPVIKIDKQYSSKLFSPGRKVVRNK